MLTFQDMKKGAAHFVVLIIMLFVCYDLHPESGSFSAIPKVNDTIHNKSMKEHREQEKHNLKHSHKRVFVKVSFIYAKLIIKI